MVGLVALMTSVVPGGLATRARADMGASVPEVQSCVARPELGPGATGEDVRCLQYLLILLGLPVGYTGVYDDATVNAVRFYQGVHPPLTADGAAGEQTLISLGIRSDPAKDGDRPAAGAPGATVQGVTGTTTCLADAEQQLGSKGQSVVCLQQRMTELGLYRGKANGSFDAALQQALRGYQQARPPLTVDGRAGPRTLAALGIWSGVSPANSVASGSLGDVASTTSLTAEPQWTMTADGIPFFGTHKPCSRADAITIATEFARDGADIATQYWAVYIASREGGCRFEAININPATKDDSHCTFQINVLSGTFEAHGELGRRGWTPELVRTNMRNCADAASDLWVFCGRGPWTPPYSCKPPWEGATSNPMDPIVTTTTAPAETLPADTSPVDPTPVTDPPSTQTTQTTQTPTTETVTTSGPDPTVTTTPPTGTGTTIAPGP